MSERSARCVAGAEAGPAPSDEIGDHPIATTTTPPAHIANLIFPPTLGRANHIRELLPMHPYLLRRRRAAIAVMIPAKPNQPGSGTLALATRATAPTSILPHP